MLQTFCKQTLCIETFCIKIFEYGSNMNWAYKLSTYKVEVYTVLVIKFRQNLLQDTQFLCNLLVDIIKMCHGGKTL